MYIMIFIAYLNALKAHMWSINHARNVINFNVKSVRTLIYVSNAMILIITKYWMENVSANTVLPLTIRRV